MNLIQELEPIKIAFMSGQIDYKKAKEVSMPIIEKFNERAKEIAEKYGKKPIKKTFAGCFR